MSCPSCATPNACIVTDPPITALGTCAAGLVWNGCYKSGVIASCCCGAATTTAKLVTSTAGPPSNVPCPACTAANTKCFVTDPVIPSLGFCSNNQVFYGCYNAAGAVTSCCCGAATTSTVGSTSTTGAPANKACPDCTAANTKCYVTDPAIPALGYCNKPKSFYGCYNAAGAITSCCCK